jgi:hypothetical protein
MFEHGGFSMLFPLLKDDFVPTNNEDMTGCHLLK